MIEERGFYAMFMFVTLIGVVAIVLCVFEWIREYRYGNAAGVVVPDPVAVPAE
jgi:PAT family beta-lactamase induction signal transducer AmpG